MENIDLRKANTLSLADAANFYIQNCISIVPLNEKDKSTYVNGWTKPEFHGDMSYWIDNPNRNIGIALGKNRLLSLDIDNTENFVDCMDAVMPAVLDAVDVDTPFYELLTAEIVSGRGGSGKKLFRMPPVYAKILTPYKLSWRKEGCVFELRCAGQQDVVAPSIHPDTGKPYQWKTGGKTFEFLDAPKDLLYLWTHWGELMNCMLQADPDYVPEKPKRARSPYKPAEGSKSAVEIMDAWSCTQNLVSWLEKYGYSTVRGNRLVYDSSKTGIPGCVIVRGVPDKFFTSHASDMEFFAWEGNRSKPRPHTAFDIMCVHECGGDVGKAIRRAKEELGYE